MVSKRRSNRSRGRRHLASPTRRSAKLAQALGAGNPVARQWIEKKREFQLEHVRLAEKARARFLEGRKANKLHGSHCTPMADSASEIRSAGNVVVRRQNIGGLRTTQDDAQRTTMASFSNLGWADGSYWSNKHHAYGGP